MRLALSLKIAVCRIDGVNNRLASEHACRDRSRKRRRSVPAAELGESSRYAARRNGPRLPTLDDRQFAECRAAESHRPVEHRVEYRHEIAGRGVNDLQYLGGRGLLLQCL